MEQSSLVRELTPVAERLYERHDATAKEWFPHELVPWGQGRDFDADETWDPAEVPMPAGVRSALFVNLLTEDNLPYYFRTIEARRIPGRAGQWRVFSQCCSLQCPVIYRTCLSHAPESHPLQSA